MSKEKFNERAYEILYNQYKDILQKIMRESSNLEYRSRDSGELLKEDRPEYLEKKVELAEDLSKDKNAWIKRGFISREDMEVINNLEYCLGELEFFKRE